MTHLKTPEQWLQMYDLALYAFQKEDPSEKEKAAFLSLCQASQPYGILAGKQVQSQLIATPYTVQFAQQTFSMSGVGYVSSYPEVRGKGHIRQLFSDYLQEQAQQGCCLSYLDPFSSMFYRKFGYEQLFDRVHATISSTLFAQVPSENSGFLERIDWETATSAQKKAIQTLYSQTLGQQDGAVARSSWNWDYRFAHRQNHQLVLCSNENHEIEGYCIYERKSGQPFIIHEFAPRTAFAIRKLSSFIASHASSFEHFRFIHSPQQAVRTLYPEYSAWQQTLKSFMMARIVSLPAFLAQFPFRFPAERASWRFCVNDSLVPLNHGTWQLELGPDGSRSFTRIATEVEENLPTKTIGEWTTYFLSARSSLFPKQEAPELASLNSSLPSFDLGLSDYF